MGITADRQVLAVLDNGAVPDVGLACLRVVLFDDGVQQPSEGLEEVPQHGRCTWDVAPALWRRLLAPSRRLCPLPL